MLAWASGVPTGAACGRCGVRGREPGPMHDVRGSDAVTATGTGETAPSGEFVGHEHQRQSVQSDSWGGRAYPYPPRWRHACTARHGAATNQGAGQRAVGNLLGWQKGDGRAGHRDVQGGHQSNGGDVACEGT
jgi:hypothetical protein